jgi:hypothetical protein
LKCSGRLTKLYGQLFSLNVGAFAKDLPGLLYGLSRRSCFWSCPSRTFPYLWSLHPRHDVQDPEANSNFRMYVHIQQGVAEYQVIGSIGASANLYHLAQGRPRLPERDNNHINYFISGHGVFLLPVRWMVELATRARPTGVRGASRTSVFLPTTIPLA